MKSRILKAFLLSVTYSVFALGDCYLYGKKVDEKDAEKKAAEVNTLKYWKLTPQEVAGVDPYMKAGKDLIAKINNWNTADQLSFAQGQLGNVQENVDTSKSSNDQEHERIQCWKNNPDKIIEVLFASAIIASNLGNTAEDGVKSEHVGCSSKALTFAEGRAKAQGVYEWLKKIFENNDKEQLAQLIHAMHYPDHPYMIGAWFNIKGDKVLLKPHLDGADNKWLGVFARKCTTEALKDNYEFFVPYTEATKSTDLIWLSKEWVLQNKVAIAGGAAAFVLICVFLKMILKSSAQQNNNNLNSVLIA